MALLLHHLSRLASPQVPSLLIFSLLLFIQAALSSLLVRGHRRLFSGLHEHQVVTHPRIWRPLLHAGDLFFARLVPALGSVGQALMLFHYPFLRLPMLKRMFGFSLDMRPGGWYQWRVRFLPLAVWTCLLNALIFALIVYVQR